MIPFHHNPFERSSRVSSALEHLLGTVHSWIVLTSSDGKVTQISQAAQQDLCLGPEWLGKPIHELPCWTPESSQKLAEGFAGATELTLVVVSTEGQQTVQFMVTPILQRNGKTTGLIFESLTTLSAGTLPQVLHRTQVAIAILDAHEHLIWANHALGLLLQQSAGDLHTVKISDMVGFSLAGNTLDELDFHTRWTRQDGVDLWLKVSVRRVLLPGETLPYTLLEFTDSTEEFKVRHELEGLKTRLELALHSSGIGTWEWDIQQNTLLWDHRMCEIYGIQSSDFTGRFESWPRLVHPEDSGKVVGFTFQAMSGQARETELRILLPDGTVRHTRVVAHQVRDEGGNTVRLLGTSWDITREKQIELELREAHRIAQIGSWKWDLHTRNLEWSEDFRRMLGFGEDAPSPTMDTLSALLTPRSLLDLQQAIQEATQSEEDFALDLQMTGSSKARWIHLRGRTAQNREGQVVSLYGTAQDITPSRTAREELSTLSNRLLLATEAGGIGIWEWDSGTMHIEMDPRMAELMGVPGSEPTDVYGLIHQHIHPDDQTLLEEFFRAVAEGKSTQQDILHADFRVLLPRGKVRVLRSHAKVLPGQNSQEFRMLGTAWDITDQKTTEHMIRHQANHDALTDLPNRRLFFELLSQEIRNTSRTDYACAVLFIDLDRFKEVNDTYGHQAGDELLKEVSNRLKMCTRSSDVLARLSGDEFVIMLTHLTEMSPAAMIAERILAILSHPIRIGRENVTITASIGIAVYPHDADDANKLLIYADQAMYNAKNDGKNRYAFFQKAMQEQAVEKRTVTHELSLAIRRNELEMYYQPILDLNSHRIVKAEALLRWKHPEKGFVSPGVFIPIAEETDLIHQLGDWVFRTVVQQIKTWDSEDLHPIDVSVNVSAKQFLQRGTMERFMGYIQDAGIQPERLIIEITESVFLQDAFEIAEQFRLIQEAGIRLALDDFGTGYSSLNYLTRFDTRFIKIDRSFVKNLEANTSSPIIDAIIAMSHQLGKTVIAEGVETKEQVQWLKDRDCDYVQGYYYARPMPAVDFVQFVHQFLTENAES